MFLVFLAGREGDLPRRPPEGQNLLNVAKNISQKIENLDLVNYSPMDFSRMYFNYEDFKNSKKKITNLKSTDEKKIQKKKEF